MKMTSQKAFISSLALAGCVSMASAAESGLVGWTYNPLYDDHRLQDLLDSEVYTSGREEMGDVHDVLINERGQIQALIVATGGFLGINEKYFNVPIQNAQYEAQNNRVTLNQTKAEVEKIQKEDKHIKPGADQWSADVLMDMPANMDGKKPYGEIQDLLWDPQTNQISAVLVEPDGWEAEIYALPWGEGSILKTVDEGYVYFPYREADVAALGIFILPVADRNQTAQQGTQQGSRADTQQQTTQTSPQQQTGQTAQQLMQRLDQDKNQQISQKEAQQHDQLGQDFAEVDNDNDGELSAEELSDWDKLGRSGGQ